MGKRSDFKRRKNDAYMTPDEAIAPLLSILPKGCSFIEPCGGAGAIVDFLEASGHECIDYFDIDPQREDVKKMDAFDYGINNYYAADTIITNPPWLRSKASDFLLHRMIKLWSSIRPTYLLFDADWMHNIGSAELVENYCVKALPIGRVKWIQDSPHSSVDNVCWYLFDAQEGGQPMQFLPRKKFIK